VASFGSAEKNLNMGAQLQTIAYIKTPKVFIFNARLNNILVITNGGIAVCFSIIITELTIIMWSDTGVIIREGLLSLTGMCWYVVAPTLS